MNLFVLECRIEAICFLVLVVFIMTSWCVSHTTHKFQTWRRLRQAHVWSPQTRDIAIHDALLPILPKVLVVMVCTYSVDPTGRTFPFHTSACLMTRIADIEFDAVHKRWILLDEHGVFSVYGLDAKRQFSVMCDEVGGVSKCLGVLYDPEQKKNIPASGLVSHMANKPFVSSRSR